jgi:hypothetical protein
MSVLPEIFQKPFANFASTDHVIHLVAALYAMGLYSMKKAWILVFPGMTSVSCDRAFVIPAKAGACPAG